MKMNVLSNKLKAGALTLSLLLFFPQSAFSHGEDRPGPHGGHIRMPGAFHTEVALAGKEKIKIYLLDFNWKNPSRNGKVEARLGKRTATCKGEKDNFLCSFPKGSDLTRGTLTIRAEREGKKGADVYYDLPL